VAENARSDIAGEIGNILATRTILKKFGKTFLDKFS